MPGLWHALMHLLGLAAGMHMVVMHGPKLALRTHTDTKTVASCQCRSWVLCILQQGHQEKVEENRKGLRQLLSANAKSCGALSNRRCRGSTVAVVAIGFLNIESCSDHLWRGLLRSVMRSSMMNAAGVLQHPEGCHGPQWQRLLGSSAEQATGNHVHSHCMADTGSPCPSSLFLAISRCLSYASLWVG